MLGNIFTLDYEIHGNGEGSPMDLMVEPTSRLLKLFDRYGAKLTIMADVGELMKFEEYKTQNGEDLFCFDEIVNQLQQAVLSGHDVQLHIHSSYFKSYYQDGMWRQNWSEYCMAQIPYDRLNEIIASSKSFLERIIAPVKPEYRCTTFRAANWSMNPSHNLVRALIANDIKVDTSVFKYGKRDEIVKFDYSNAYSSLIPWLISEQDVQVRDPEGKLLEVPIFCQEKPIWSFLSTNRIYRVLQAFQHRHPDGPEDQDQSSKKDSLYEKISSLILQKHARKMDFNQCTGNQLAKILKSIDQGYSHENHLIPVVSIGHSKIFTGMNENSLEDFLKYVVKNKDKYCFATFEDFNLKDLAALGELYES